MSIRYQFLTKNLTYITSHVTPTATDVMNGVMAHFDLAMDMLADGRIDPGPLMTHTFPSSQFPEAYMNASNYENEVIKTIVTWNEDWEPGPGAGRRRRGGERRGGDLGVRAVRQPGAVRQLPAV